jgi:hypothetical protein
MIISRLDALHEDVTYIRSKQDEQSKDITELKVQAARKEGRDRTLKVVFSAVVPFLVALMTTAAAIAFGL